MTSTGRDKISLERALRVLRDLPLLRGLTDEEFRLAIQNLRPESLIRGKVLISPGEANTNLYVIRRGKLGFRRIAGSRRETEATMIGSGQVVNLHAFLTGARNDFTIEAEEDTELIYIERAGFQVLLRSRPEISDKLQMPQDVQSALKERKDNAWMIDGEKIDTFERRHWWSFASKLIPLVLLFIALAVAYWQIPGFPPGLAGVALLIAALWAGWHLVDWRNDFYAVTNYRVIHRERVLLFRDDQEDAPLDKVQNTSVNQGTLLAQLLDYGDVSVETAGTGAAVTFGMIGNPRQVMERIITLRDQTKSLVWATERQRIRSDLRVEINLAPKPPEVAKPPSAFKAPIKLRWEAFVKSLGNARNTLLPRVRLQEGEKITYRKHWLRLLETAGLQMGLVLVLFPVVFGLVLFTQSFQPVQGLGIAVYAASLLGAVGWFVWQYEDWRNDIYVLDKDRVIDIDRSPFGLRGTQRKEARYDSIQNVSAKTKGLIDMAFNVGDVTVKTGGADNALVFERVYDPQGVQRELQRKIDAFMTGKKQQEADQRRHELAETIGIYDELRGLHGPRAINRDGAGSEDMVR